MTHTSTLAQETLTSALARFGDANPTPGGGSAAALAGALGAHLGHMVAGLTVGKKGYEAAEPEARALANEATRLADKLTAAIAEDAHSFEAVMAAMALPKAADEDKATRKAAMQEAFKGATLSPLAVARACVAVGRMALRLLEIGNRNAASDAGVAALLAGTGAEGALLNVAINWGAIQDEAFLADHRDEVAALWGEAARLRADLWTGIQVGGLDVPR